MKKAVALLLSPLLLALAPAARAGDPATAPKTLPDNLVVETLDNGLQVVIEERRATPIAHVRALMKIGSIYEGEYLGCGLSHWMEHIVAGGSTRRKEAGPDGAERWVGRTEDENKEIIKSLGGDHNASTFFDYTNYFITTQASMTETALDLIADWLQHCQFDPEAVAREQKVVQQELLRNEDNPQRLRAQLFGETLLKVHPARVPVIGYVDSIQRVTRADMMRFYDLHYTPQNCVVSVVGDVDAHAVLALVRKHFGGWKRKPLAPYLIPEEPEQTSMRWVEREHGSTKTCLVTMGVPTIPLLHPDLYALDMMSAVLGVGESARLPAKFEQDPRREAVATQIGCGNLTPIYGGGRFAVGFGADTVANARKLAWEVWGEVERMKEDLVSREEIDRVLKVIEKYVYEERAKLDDRAQALAENLAWLADPLYADTYLANLRKVTPEEVREAARKYLRRDRLNVVIVTPPSPPAEKAPRGAAEAEGAVRKVVLDNGLTVLLKRLPDYGLVDAAIVFHGGVVHEAPDQNGLFLLMANSFWRGTASMPYPALVRRMDDLGMELSAESQNNTFQVRMKALSSDLEPSFAVFADVIRRPAIDPVWVDQVRKQVLERVLPNLAVNAEEMIQRVLRQALYPRSPYRNQRFGTPETVKGFDAAKVRALYEAFARPNNAVLAMYGDMDLDKAEAMVRAALGDWARGEIPASFAVEDPGISEPRTVELTNRQVRTNYVLAWRAYSRQEEEKRIPMGVMNAILGASGWLHHRLREGKADYVYSVYSAAFPGDRAGHFFVNTDFSPKDEAAVLGIIDGAIADMRAGKFTDEELDVAKRMILCWDALGKQSNADVAQGDAVSELFGQGYDYDKKYFEKVKAVTREQIVAAANEIFARPSLKILVRPQGGGEGAGR